MDTFFFYRRSYRHRDIERCYRTSHLFLISCSPSLHTIQRFSYIQALYSSPRSRWLKAAGVCRPPRPERVHPQSPNKLHYIEFAVKRNHAAAGSHLSVLFVCLPGSSCLPAGTRCGLPSAAGRKQLAQPPRSLQLSARQESSG